MFTKLPLVIRSLLRSRNKRRTASFILFFFFGLYILYISLQRSLLNNDINLEKAKKRVFQALGGNLMNEKSGIFVLPDEPTVIYEPSHNPCKIRNGDNIFTLFIVISSPQNFKERNLVRNVIKKYINSFNSERKAKGDTRKNALFFLTGVAQNMTKELEDEAKLYRDLIVENINESYLNLTLKTMRMLKWVVGNCWQAEFLVKVDDDVFVNVPKLMNFLSSVSVTPEGSQIVSGHFYNKLAPVRDPDSEYGKSYVPYEVWAEDEFPEFIGGFFYVLGFKAVGKIFGAALDLPLFHLEDVFITGIVANKKLGMKLTDMKEVSVYWGPFTNWIYTSCSILANFYAVHFHASWKYLDCWEKFNSPQFNCDDWTLALYCTHFRF